MFLRTTLVKALAPFERASPKYSSRQLFSIPSSRRKTDRGTRANASIYRGDGEAEELEARRNLLQQPERIGPDVGRGGWGGAGRRAVRDLRRPKRRRVSK